MSRTKTLPKPATSDRPVIYRTDGEVIMGLQDYYPKAQYSVLPQVRNSAGFDATRTADALVMSLWPSRGLDLTGVEIKVSRADWLRELRNPKKADEVAEFCDFWILAVGDPEIVKEGELPEPWGLMVPGKKDGSMCLKQKPSRLNAKPMTRHFLAAILRKAQEVVVPLAEVEGEIKRRVEAKTADIEQRITDRLLRENNAEWLVKKNRDLLETIVAFEKASGCSITHLDYATQVGAALKLMKWSGLHEWMSRAVTELDTVAAQIRKVQEALLQEALPAAEPVELENSPIS